jgi:hypothetical protein
MGGMVTAFSLAAGRRFVCRCRCSRDRMVAATFETPGTGRQPDAANAECFVGRLITATRGSGADLARLATGYLGRYNLHRAFATRLSGCILALFHS